MLSSLRIQNVVLIETLDIIFQEGLCTLTGETGAGKSILLDSLGLATGARADSGLVRKGAQQASVSAVFEVEDSHISKSILEEQGLEFEETLVLRRVLNADGKSRAFINDQPVSAGLLRTIGQSLLEVHGQFDTQGLLDAKTHRVLLDEYAQIDSAKTIGACWDDWQQKEKRVQGIRERSAAGQEREAYLRTSLEDLDGLDPQSGEEESLSDLRESLMHREQILEALNTAYHALNAEHDPVRSAWGALDRVADKVGEQLTPAIEALNRASVETQEALSAIQDISADLEHSEHDLESIDNRLFALRAQARKHNCNVDDLADKREELAQELNQIENADDALDQAIHAAKVGKESYYNAALSVSEKRKMAAKTLDELVAKELKPLKLDRAQFVTTIETQADESAWTRHGIDTIAFLVATNPGSEPGALNKIASGGEMSRFMLALKVVMAQTGAAQTLVFDEVDAGIGGSTADAVGERLAALSQSKQILVVTHSPQVAARAAHHYTVHKQGQDTLTTSVLCLTDAKQRREEIARMLAGAEITQEARAAADKLLETSKAA